MNLQDSGNKDRGPGLSLFLILSAIASIPALWVLWFESITQYDVPNLWGFVIPMPVLIFLFIIGIWAWKQWAFYGLVLTYGVAIIVSFLAETVPVMLFFMAELALLIPLVLKKRSLFD